MEQGGEQLMTHVWVVVTDDSYDNVYVFEDEDQARTLADRWDGGASVTEEVIITRENGVGFLNLSE